MIDDGERVASEARLLKSARLACAIFLLLSTVDGVSTEIMYAQGLIAEANPLMHKLLVLGPGCLTFARFAYHAALVVVIYHVLKRRCIADRRARMYFWAIPLSYAFVYVMGSVVIHLPAVKQLHPMVQLARSARQ